MKNYFTLAALVLFSKILLAQCPPPGFPPIADDCITASFNPICVDLDGYCDQLLSNNVQQSFPGCPMNALNNDSWFSFYAGTSQITIEVIPSNCQNTAPNPVGMQGAIYEGGCGGPVVASQCDCVTVPFSLSSSTFIPGELYFIVFDGCAGDVCDFAINITSGSTIPGPPGDPGAIVGASAVCPGAVVDYTLQFPDASTYDWSISPPSMGSIISPNPSPEIAVEWNSFMTGSAQLCVTASNQCGVLPSPICLDITSTIIQPSTQEYTICLGDCVECAEQEFCFETPPTGIPVTLQSYLGCDSVINCIINTILVPPNDLGQQTYCAPASIDICGETYTQSGTYTPMCESYQGCDSTVIVDLAILDPMAAINQPLPTIGCGGNATVQLDGSNSSMPVLTDVEMSYEWTGPGIVGASDNTTVTIDEGGQYCLIVTHSRNGVECSDTTCVDIMQDAGQPNPPTLMGNLSPCENTSAVYTVTPTGTPAPTGYTWTTPNGEPFTNTSPTSIEVTWNNAMGGQLCVTADNDCGASTPACIQINVGGLPLVPTINGPATACASNQTLAYSVSNVETGVTYSWSANNGASTSGSGPNINVNFSGASGTVDVCVTATNSCGMTNSCVPVSVTTPPGAPLLMGPNSVCSNGGGYNYSVSSPDPTLTYTWTAPTNASITGTGPNVNIDFMGASTGQVCVTAANTCGMSMPQCQSVTVVQAPSAIISGSGSFCQGNAPNTNLTINLTGSGPWDVGYAVNGGTPTLINITSSPFILPAAQAGTYTLTSLTAGGTCTGTVSGMATVTENPSPTATLSGTGTICAGSGEVAPLSITLTGTAPWEVCWAVDGNDQAPLNINATPFTLNISQAQAGAITLTCVNDDNNCDGTTSGSATVDVEQSPTVSDISTSCNANNTDYTVTFSVNGGDPGSYQVIPNSGSFSGNVYTSAPIPSGDGYSFGVTDGNACDTVMVSDPIVICNCTSSVGSMDLTPVENCGDGNVSVNYDLVGQMYDGNDITNFVLHSGNGASIVDPILGQYTLPIAVFEPATMDYGTTYYFSAVVGDDTGNGLTDLDDPCLAVSQGTPITWYDIPTASLGLGTSICDGETASLSVGFLGEAPFSITYDDGTGLQTLNGITDNPYNLMVSPTMTTQYCLTGMTDLHCPAALNACATVTVNTGLSVSNIQTTCNATATAYVVTFDITGGDPTSYFSTGNPGTINPMTGEFVSDEITAGGGYSIVVDDANNCSPQPVEAPEVICNCQTEAGTIPVDTLSYCSDGPTSDASTTSGEMLDGDDVLQYVLHTAASNVLGTIIATDLAPTNFSFNAATMNYGTVYYISPVAGNDDGTGNVDLGESCLSVSPGTPVVFYEVPTAAFSGGTEICPGETADLTIDLTGDSPWTLTINGEIIDSITGTPYTYPVNPAVTTTYDLTLVEDEHCEMALAESQTVTIHEPPSITTLTTDCNASATAYTVTIDIAGGDASCYMVSPMNGTLTGSQFVSDEIPGGTGYTFSISDCFGCPPVVVSDTVSCNCLTSSGDLDGASLEICGAGSTGFEYFDDNEFLDADDELCFILHDGNNIPIATNPNEPVFSFQSGLMAYGQTYFVCPVAGNDNGAGCANLNDPCLSFGICSEVTFYEIPTATLSGGGNICGGSTAQLSVALTGAGPWDIVYQNAADTMFNETAMSSPLNITVSPMSSTVYSLVSMAGANCDGTVSGNAIVNVNMPPQAVSTTLLCDPNGLTYTVSFDIVGGDPTSYTIDPPGNLSGSSFTSNPINSGDAYSFLVDDANLCGPFNISGSFLCDCDTEAGIMGNTSLSLCESETATAVFQGGEFLEPDDVLVFVLHDNNGNTLGNVLATNPDEPVFTYDPGTMTAGVTYYISAVAGDDDGTGTVDTTDPCISVAPGTPVVFNENPTIDITESQDICEGENATITLTMTGAAPYTIDLLQNSNMETVNSPTGSFDFADIGETTTIELVSIQDNNGCSATSSATSTVTVSPAPDAGQAGANLEFCENESNPVTLADQIEGEDAGGLWTDANGQTIPDGQVEISNLPTGTNTFTYTVTGTGTCPDDQTSMNIIVQAQPMADAGADLTITCDEPEVTVGGPNTTPNQMYAWTDADGMVVSDAANFTTGDGGIFTLTVTSSFGCSDVDAAEVDEAVDSPLVEYMTQPVSCFGDENGFIGITTVTGGTPPYLYSFEGGPFLPDNQFTGLAPGTYTILVEDDAGCQSPIEIIINEPQEVTVSIDGEFTGDEPVVELGNSTELGLTTTPPVGELDTIMWSTGESTPSITIEPVQQTNYSVVVDENGCTASDQLTVFINKNLDVYIPNAFSPNGDGMNDAFQIYPGKNVTRIKSFLVFSRWGETMFELYDFDPRNISDDDWWKGTHKGNELNAAVFTYFAEVEFIDGSVELLEGDVILIR